MKAIGIDIGTTSICGILLDAVSGEILKSQTKNSDAFIKGAADWEKIQSVDKIITLAADILEDLVDVDTKVIGVTGQMHGIVYVDKNGNAVSPLYTWQDERGNQPYKDTTYARYLGSYSGYGNVTDFYNTENHIRPNDAEYFCTIQDYFVMKLCGLKKPLIHITNARSFGAEDKCGGEIINDYKIAGTYKDIPVSIAIGDNQASVFSTLSDEKCVLVNVGTGSQVSVVSEKELTGNDIECRPYFENKYLIVGAALCGGRAYGILKNFYKEIFMYKENISDDAVYDIMGKMLEKADKSLLKVDTRFAGTRNNPEYSGSISDIKTDNFTPENLTFGVLLGMTEELYNMFMQMKIKTNGVIGSGNGVRKNKAFVNIIEEKFGGDLKMPVHTEEAAVGSAMFGLVSCGIYKNAEEVQKLIRYEE